MAQSISRVPGHVLTAFQVDHSLPSRDLGIAWGYGVGVGDVALVPASAHTNFSVTVREQLGARGVRGLRLARPLRSTDGRSSVGGWAASQLIDGDPEPRIDETVSSALRLSKALSEVDVPEVKADPDSLAGLFQRAEREAWQYCDENFGTIDAPVSMGHIDMLGTTLYEDCAAPVISDLVPTAAARPLGYTAALAIVDGLIAKACDPSIMERFGYVSHLVPLALRGVFFREKVSALLDSPSSITRSNIRAVKSAIMSRL